MLANWFFSWDEAAWSGSSSSGEGAYLLTLMLIGMREEAPVPEPVPEAEAPERRGGGHRKENDDLRYPADFWLVRERYLRRFLPPDPDPPAADPPEREDFPEATPVEAATERRVVDLAEERLWRLHAARQQAIALAQQAESARALRAQMAEITRLTLDIARVQSNNRDQAIAFLLLEPF